MPLELNFPDVTSVVFRDYQIAIDIRGDPPNRPCPRLIWLVKPGPIARVGV